MKKQLLALVCFGIFMTGTQTVSAEEWKAYQIFDADTSVAFSYPSEYSITDYSQDKVYLYLNGTEDYIEFYLRDAEPEAGQYLEEKYFQYNNGMPTEEGTNPEKLADNVYRFTKRNGTENGRNADITMLGIDLPEENGVMIMTYVRTPGDDSYLETLTEMASTLRYGTAATGMQATESAVTGLVPKEAVQIQTSSEDGQFASVRSMLSFSYNSSYRMEETQYGHAILYPTAEDIPRYEIFRSSNLSGEEFLKKTEAEQKAAHADLISEEVISEEKDAGTLKSQRYSYTENDMEYMVTAQALELNSGDGMVLFVSVCTSTEEALVKAGVDKAMETLKLF